jgi:hypothetical protein
MKYEKLTGLTNVARFLGIQRIDLKRDVRSSSFPDIENILRPDLMNLMQKQPLNFYEKYYCTDQQWADLFDLSVEKLKELFPTNICRYDKKEWLITIQAHDQKWVTPNAPHVYEIICRKAKNKIIPTSV